MAVVAELYLLLSLLGEVMGWGEEFNQGTYDSLLLSEGWCSVTSPGPSGPVDQSP